MESERSFSFPMSLLPIPLSFHPFISLPPPLPPLLLSHLPSSPPQDVEPSVVKLLVIENLMLMPSMDVYLLPLSFVDYHIQRRKHGRTEVVPLPSSQYSLHLSNLTVAELDPLLSRVMGLVLGFTEVVVEDQSILLF